MTSRDMAKELSALVQLDIDAVHAYGQVDEAIGPVEFRNQLLRFRNDHEKHIEQLSAVLRALDADPPVREQDFKGFVLEGFTAIENHLGVEEALLAMKTNEELINQRYKEAFIRGFTPRIGELVAYYYLDEQTHLQFIEKLLAGKSWEK